MGQVLPIFGQNRAHQLSSGLVDGRTDSIDIRLRWTSVFFGIGVGFGRESENRERLENKEVEVVMWETDTVVWGRDQRVIERVSRFDIGSFRLSG